MTVANSAPRSEPAPKMPKDGQLYVTAGEAAAMIGVCRKTVLGWVRRPSLNFPPPCRYIGPVAYWRRSDICAWMEPQR